MKKIKITESQFKKLKRGLNENLDMPTNNFSNMSISVGEVAQSHLSEVLKMINDVNAHDRLNFIKILIKKYPDTNQKISAGDLDNIYDEMLNIKGDTQPDQGLDDFNKDQSNDDNENPFPDGYDFSLNEELKRKIKIDFDKYL